jgi:hypothetical protein
MIVQRMEWRIKNSMMDTAVKLLREEDNAALSVAPHKRSQARIYTSMFGTVSIVAMEWTYTSIAENNVDNEAWFSTGRVPAFLDKWDAVLDKIISNEIYDLHSSYVVEDSKNTIAIRWIRKPVTRRNPEFMDNLDKWIVNTGKYTARVMDKMYGVAQGVFMEIEYADLMDYQSQLQEWLKQPGIESFWKIHNEIAEPEGSTEVWNLMP